MTAYSQLETRFARLAALGEATAVLHWDMAAMMPAGGVEARAEQLAALKRVQHDMMADPALSDLLDRAEGEGGLDGWQGANLREMRREWLHATALDGALVEALAKTCAASEMAWRAARSASDFPAARPHLEAVLALVREAAQAKAARLRCAPYDALLDEYEPGGRAAEIEPVFASYAAFLPGFLARVLERQAARGPALPLDGPFPVAAQKALAREFMAALGFDFAHGRLDESHHPFCGGVPEDVRITTRYDEADFSRGLMGVLHETGHALYERNLPPRWRRQPVGRARGMSAHESQSLLVEMQACRGRAFFDYAAPRMRAAFGREGPAWSADNLHRHYTRVAAGFIRVDADEVTYPAHVILRMRLERAMIAGDLAAADLPGAWNEGMAALLGLVPPDDRRGCLQDIHWYDGA
ncbi:MAG: carboxypeptidase M32, partial [Alphaproteobacteria bacterium]|nr:carboxypeptidase M32 [Alphaproteobacteria bacterium]